jgi:DNA-3-methyladenine glycosylase I
MENSGESFAELVWKFVDHTPIVRPAGEERIVKTELSTRISEELKKRGFKFVGPTIVYAWMQAVGMVDDHEDRCFVRKRSE